MIFRIKLIIVIFLFCNVTFAQKNNINLIAGPAFSYSNNKYENHRLGYSIEMFSDIHVSKKFDLRIGIGYNKFSWRDEFNVDTFNCLYSKCEWM